MFRVIKNNTLYILAFLLYQDRQGQWNVSAAESGLGGEDCMLANMQSDPPNF